MIGEREVVNRIEGLTIRQLRSWVRHGWVCPARGESGLAFSQLDLARVSLIRQLHQDLKVNPEAVPIVLSLMDQVYGLRRELRNLARAVESQPPAVRDSILDVVRSAYGKNWGDR